MNLVEAIEALPEDLYELLTMYPEAEKCSSLKCPVARFLSDKMGKLVQVTRTVAYDTPGHVEGTRLPDRVSKWITDFDLS